MAATFPKVRVRLYIWQSARFLLPKKSGALFVRPARRATKSSPPCLLTLGKRNRRVEDIAMNGRQIGVLCAGLGVMGILLLFPPFDITPNLGEILKAQLGGLFGAPAPPAPALIKYAFLFAPPAGSAGVDWPRAWPPIAFAAVATGLLVAAFGRRAATQ